MHKNPVRTFAVFQLYISDGKHLIFVACDWEELERGSRALDSDLTDEHEDWEVTWQTSPVLHRPSCSSAGLVTAMFQWKLPFCTSVIISKQHCNGMFHFLFSGELLLETSFGAVPPSCFLSLACWAEYPKCSLHRAVSNKSEASGLTKPLFWFAYLLKTCAPLYTWKKLEASRAFQQCTIFKLIIFSSHPRSSANLLSQVNTGRQLPVNELVVAGRLISVPKR